ncbi:hypothetical protein ColTof4_14075 [Colletotrichum tofieldiae]|nr:hypothetical protein ColTof3_14712 [Colletotrichum tofieldiae]GKT81652.1 hypothetical protein ColTof4_14075 [Colletotrichum tofieldiae]
MSVGLSHHPRFPKSVEEARPGRNLVANAAAAAPSAKCRKGPGIATPERPRQARVRDLFSMAGDYSPPRTPVSQSEPLSGQPQEEVEQDEEQDEEEDAETGDDTADTAEACC